MTKEALNGRLLWSHCLSNKVHGQDAPVKVADACCGIQSQSLQESLSSFWARIDRFSNSDVVSELKPRGGLVRTWAVRSAMHTIPSKDYYLYILGGASERMLHWIDTLAKKANFPPREERTRLFYEPFLDEIRGREFTHKEASAFVDARVRRLGLRKGVWTGLGDMAFMGLVVHAGKQGSRSLWMRSDEWVPRPKTLPDRQTCRIELVRKYIARHGPVSKEDIVYWSYLTKGQLEVALGNLEDDLVEVKMSGSKEPYIALEEGIDEEVQPPPKAIVLPKYDALLLSLRDKSRFMDMAHYKEIFPKIPVGMVKPTVLVDGFVSATWKKDAKKTSRSIEVQPLRRLSTSDKEAVEHKFIEYCQYAAPEASISWTKAT